MATTRTFQTTAGVYGLKDPRTGRMMYIGQSVDIEYRYRSHCNLMNFAESNHAKAAWVAELDRAELRPELVILAEATWPDSDAIERDLIAEYRGRGECELNRAGGGMGVRSSSKAAQAHPDDWFQLGLTLKRARTLIGEAVDQASKLAGNKETERGLKAIQALGRFRSSMEDALLKAQPRRHDLTKVFYGPIDE